MSLSGLRRVCLVLVAATATSTVQAQTTGMAIDDSLFQPIRLPATMPFGYPPNDTYLPRIMELIRQRQFDSLDTFFDGLAADVKLDVRNEIRFTDAFEATDRSDPNLLSGLDAWVAARPGSAHARVARGTYHLSSALRRRGSTSVRELTPATLRSIRESAKKGIQDVGAALEVDTTHLVAYQIGVGMLILGGMPDGAFAMMERGLSFHRGSYILPRMAVFMLWPRWGGSEEMMKQFAEEAARDSAINPRLVTLRGAIYEARASDSAIAGNLAGAIRELNKALGYGPDATYLADRGKLYFRMGAYEYAFGDLRAVMMERSQDREVLEFYGRTLVELAAKARPGIRPTILERAIEVLSLAAYLDPPNERVETALARAKRMAGK